VLLHAKLQWGRRQQATESLEMKRYAYAHLTASMGPSPTGDGERPCRPGSLAQLSAASMGPSPTGDGEDLSAGQ